MNDSNEDNKKFSRVKIILVSVSLVLATALLLTGIGLHKFYTSEKNLPIAAAKDFQDNPVSPISSAKRSFTITLSFAGDTILANDYNLPNAPMRYNDYAEKNPPSYFFEKVKPIFESDDFTLVNLENVFTDKELTERPKNHSPAFWFRSKCKNVDVLKSGSVEGASICNNHIYDYGEEGYNDTLNTVKNAGLECGTENDTIYFEKNGFKVAIICSTLWGSWESDKIINRLKESQNNSDYQVVFFHGGTERLHSPEEWKKSAARSFVDNGADLVVGGHPHVLQPREIYNGTEIIYSIGNFCFGANRQPENRTIIYQMQLTVSSDLNLIKATSNIIPCYVYRGEYNNYQPSIVEDEVTKNKILDFMDGKISSPV